MKTYVLVTGATGGIGSALIKRILPEEAVDTVLGVCRNPIKWESVFTKEKNQFREKLLQIPSGPEEMTEALTDFLKQRARENTESAQMILVLSAFSIQPAERALSIEGQALRENLYGNLEEPIRQLQAAAALCRQYGIACKIVYLGSGAARKPLKGWSLYGAGKSFMNLFLQTLSIEEQIPVVSFDPGVTDTAMQQQIRDIPEEIFDQVQTFRDYKTKHRLHTAEEVADYLTERYILEWKAEAFEECYRREWKRE